MFKLRTTRDNPKELVELRKQLILSALYQTCGSIHEAARICEVSPTRMIDLLRYHKIDHVPQEIRFRAMRRFAITDKGVQHAYEKSICAAILAKSRKHQPRAGQERNFEGHRAIGDTQTSSRSLRNQPHDTLEIDPRIGHWVDCEEHERASDTHTTRETKTCRNNKKTKGKARRP